MKKIFFKSLACLATGFLFTSCSAIFCGSRATVTFDTDAPVEEATLMIDGIKYNVDSFPYSMKIKRGFYETAVKAEAKGYEPTWIYIYKNFNPVSIINLTNIIGWGIDAATGAMMQPEQKYYEIHFKKSADTQQAENSQQETTNNDQTL